MGDASASDVSAPQDTTGNPELPPDVLLLRQAGDLADYLQHHIRPSFRAPPRRNAALADLARRFGTDPAWPVIADQTVRLGLPLLDLETIEIPAEVREAIPSDLARRYGVVPVAAAEGFLVVATADAGESERGAALEFVTKARILPVLATRAAIRRALSASYDRVEDLSLITALGLDPHAGSEPGAHDIERLSGEQPVVKLVAEMIEEAAHRRASDLHLRPGAVGFDLLYRIDGDLVPVRRLHRALLPAVASRIKVIGGMNVAERRVPQDGRATFPFEGHDVDLRISVLPTVHGESVVVRLLDTRAGLRRLDEIGFSAEDERDFRDLLWRDHGLILVTGPTGCGKSTTLYAALLEARRQNVNIVTVEDPVEYQIPDVQQVQVNRAAGTTFARVLRNILRHDPDVIMIGEIRDRETAQIAVESALTGHLVLSTLHTNSAATAATRMLDLGVESFLLRSTLLGVLAQRLARRNCPECRTPETLDPHVRELMGVGSDEVFLAGRGCPACEGTGVRGRLAIYELLQVGAAVRSLIVPSADADAIHAAAVASGMVGITARAVQRARAGDIALTEAYRIRVE